MTWTHTSVVLMDKRCMSNIKDIIIENHSHAIVYKYFEIKLANLHNGTSELCVFFGTNYCAIVVTFEAPCYHLSSFILLLFCCMFVYRIRLCYNSTLVSMIHTNVNILRWLLSCKERLHHSSSYVNSEKGILSKAMGARAYIIFHNYQKGAYNTNCWPCILIQPHMPGWNISPYLMSSMNLHHLSFLYSGVYTNKFKLPI